MTGLWSAVKFYITAFLWAATAIGCFFTVAIAGWGSAYGIAMFPQIVMATITLITVSTSWTAILVGCGVGVKRKKKELPPAGALTPAQLESRIKSPAPQELSFFDVFMPKVRCPECKVGDYHPMFAPRTQRDQFSNSEWELQWAEEMQQNPAPRRVDGQWDSTGWNTDPNWEQNFQVVKKEWTEDVSQQVLSALVAKDATHDVWRRCSEKDCAHVWGQDVDTVSARKEMAG